MRATDASELLERFAAGSAQIDVCLPEGRAALRGAVRAYAAAMAEAGEAWPNLTAFGHGPQGVTSVEASVVIALAAGFVEASDLHGQSRLLAGQMQLANWPSVRDLRQAARVACPDLVALQQAASRFLIAREHYERLADRAQRSDMARDSQRRHADRMQRSIAEMQVLTETLTAKVEASRAG